MLPEQVWMPCSACLACTGIKKEDCYGSVGTQLAQLGEGSAGERHASLPAPDAELLRPLHTAADMIHSQGSAVAV